jgi:hypothetical protein
MAAYPDSASAAALLASRGSPAFRECQDCLEYQDCLGYPEFQACRDCLGYPEDCRGFQACQERQGRQVCPAFRDCRECREHQERQAPQGYRDFRTVRLAQSRKLQQSPLQL